MRLLPFLPVLLLLACGRTSPSVVERGMYHWTNDDWIRETQHAFMDTHHVQLLFCKVLDIDWNEANHAFPVSMNELPELNDRYWLNDTLRVHRIPRPELIPVVFITNRTMLRCDTAQLRTLADKLTIKLYTLCDTVRWYELQLDCDWSERSKDNYFALVRMMRERMQKRISVTIRLHQFKNPELTGVPPADRGMLMMYNLENVQRYGTQNSIFNAEAAEPYFNGAGNYPLPLDVALPNYTWVVQYRRGRFKGILDKTLVNELDTFQKVKRQTNGLYRVVEEYDWWWYDELHIGDELKVERVDSAALQQAVELARTATNNDTVRVAFFDLQENNLNNYAYATYEKAWQAFR